MFHAIQLKKFNSHKKKISKKMKMFMRSLKKTYISSKIYNKFRKLFRIIITNYLELFVLEQQIIKHKYKQNIEQIESST